MSLSESVVLVTGAAGNLGSAVARAVARQNARIVLADMQHDPLHVLAMEIGGETLIVDGADVRTAEGCARLVAEAEAKFGRVDALANTVGAFKTTDVAAGAAADWDFLMGLNALSVLRLSEAVLPGMRARGHGRIVHTAAGAAARSFAGSSVYSASKAAVMRIAEAISDENKTLGITCNCIAPGTVDTPQNRAAMPNADFSLWVSPDDIAAVFAFLLSPEAGAITGATIPVTGRG
jgi:NAD(P)-dependent dehydrogenase (short-subunit alcohol dehydrogenase family)